MTREHGMTFRPDMAAALRNGTKTQHRVLIEPQPVWMPAEGLRSHGWCWQLDEKSPPQLGRWNEPEFTAQLAKYAPWRAGDRIFVQEEFAQVITLEGPIQQVVYRADFHDSTGKYWPSAAEDPDGVIWLPAKEMDSWAARTWLEIKKIDAQRIQQISEADAVAEGIPPVHPGERKWQTTPFARDRFRDLWNSLYPGSWERNEYVWALDLKLIEKGGAG